VAALPDIHRIRGSPICSRAARRARKPSAWPLPAYLGLISLMDAQVGRDVTYDGRIFVVHGSFSRFSRYEATEPDLGLI
jgi:hypothetical protein